MSQNEIPKATARRLPLYQRAFHTLEEIGKEKISSAELSEILKIDSATIRRDFSCLGTLGRRGYGYDVPDMLNFFNNLLTQEKTIPVAVVGVGNLGGALLKESGSPHDNIKITAGFDIKEDLINTHIGDVPIYSMDNIEQQLPKLGIKTAILTVPNNRAQEVTDRLVEGGVEGILNFTSARLSIPSHVRTHHVDLSNELKILNYFMENYN